MGRFVLFQNWLFFVFLFTSSFSCQPGETDRCRSAQTSGLSRCQLLSLYGASLFRCSSHQRSFVLHSFSPKLLLAHEPEEECLLMDYSFMSQTFEATLRVPSYSKWLENQSMKKSYEYMKTLMQVLQVSCIYSWNYYPHARFYIF